MTPLSLHSEMQVWWHTCSNWEYSSGETGCVLFHMGCFSENKSLSFCEMKNKFQGGWYVKAGDSRWQILLGPLKRYAVILQL